MNTSNNKCAKSTVRQVFHTITTAAARGLVALQSFNGAGSVYELVRVRVKNGRQS